MQSFTSLINKLAVKEDLPYPSDWEREFYFENEISNLVSQLNDASRSGSKPWGVDAGSSVNQEYAFNVLHFIDSLYCSNLIRGNFHSVQPNSRIKITPSIFTESGKIKVKYQISFDDKKNLETKKYDFEEVSKNKIKLVAKIVMTAHSHPKISKDGGSYYHTWFSMQDFNFLYSNHQILVVAVVFAGHVWLVCKTNQLKNLPSYDFVYGVNRFIVSGETEQAKKYISENNSYNLVFYYGLVKQKMIKV
ncbi:MAG: hypothetical protein KatS3mg085_846 [Candidatus Dojkabacteria bacterium]|nr:MAG: hypothetical protein KatS3mg085_846 [Candidatus Dojkabacteria bacterium]